MRTRNNGYLKRFIAACLVLVLLLSLGAAPGTVANAAEKSFQKTKVPLYSNVVEDQSLTMYVKDDIYYITIEDLCRLTRCSQSVEGDVIRVTQGVWEAEFDTAKKTFYDHYQKVDITMLEVSKNQYAVDAVLFLCYFKAMVTLQDGKLVCDMPEFTAWEALAVDFGDSLVDITRLYGGETQLTFSLTCDLIIDFIMGDLSTQEGYLKDAFTEALKVDLNEYEIVEEYKATSQSKLYEYIKSKECLESMELLGKVTDLGDSATETLISFYFNLRQEPISVRLHDAKVAGDVVNAQKYENELLELMEDQKIVKAPFANFYDIMDYAVLFASVVADTARQVEYIKATGNLVYNVMGQENLETLSLSAGDNGWFAVADLYANVLEIADSELDEEIKKFYTSEVWWKALESANVSTALGISESAMTCSVLLAQLIIKYFPGTSDWIEAFEADRRAICLSELQQNVYWVAATNFRVLAGQLDDLDLYVRYIRALQLYCRTSIAMYENLKIMVAEFEMGRRDYWLDLFQDKIDKLAVSLYQLTSIQEDGAMYCLPMILESGPVVLWSDASWKPATGEENYSSYRVEPMLLMSPNLGANQMLTDDWVDLAAVVELQTNVVIANSYEDAPYSGVANLTVDSAYYAGDVLSVRMNAISYASGQAHPWHGGAVSNILFSTGEKATLQDILEPGRSYDTIREGWMKLMMGVNDLNLNQSKESIVNKAMNGQLGTWTLTQEGLEIGFAPYEISSYAAYSGTTVIPYEELKGELKAEYIPAEQTEAQESPSLEVVTTIDQYDIEDGYKVWGYETDAALVFEGDASHVTIFAADKSDSSRDDSVLFYASSLTDAVIWLPPCESGVYRVQWASGDTVAFHLVQVP